MRKIIEQRPRTKVEFWTDRKYYKNVVKITTEIGVRWGNKDQGTGPKKPYIRVRKIAAGKFNRYAGWYLRDYIKNISITLHDLIFKNIIGFIGFIAGIIQSFFRLMRKKNRPNVIFLKGGFVGLPVGLIAGLFKIPYVIHESDATPGLANRILMKKATVIATGFDLDAVFNDRAQETKTKVINVGIPVAPEYKPVTESQQRELKRAFGFDPDKLLVVITGGSQGSENINEAIREILPEMLDFISVGLVAGHIHYQGMTDLKDKYEIWENSHLQSNFRLWEFSTVMHELMGAADIVISRAGATTIAELAALKRATILVPFERLAGNHQSKNAHMLEDIGAALVVSDEKMQKKPELLLNAVSRVAKHPKERKVLAKNLHKTARPDAAQHLAEIILQVAVGESIGVGK